MGGYERDGEYVKACFVTEVVKDHNAPRGFGRWGRALFAELAAHCITAGVQEVHLITRFQHDDGQPFEFTANARALFDDLSFSTVARLPKMGPMPN